MTSRAGFALAGIAAIAAVALTTSAKGGDDLAEGRARRAQTDVRDAKDVVKDIDAALSAAWKEQGLAPTSRCSDEEFVRRVYVDLVGTIPSAAQVEAFLEDQQFEKREKLVN